MVIFDLMFVIVPIFIACVFVFTIAMIISPKLRGKMMSRQIKATKYMLDESKNDLTDIATTSSDIFIQAQKEILNNNEEDLKNMQTKKANINKESIEITANALKNGFSFSKIYCKYCGTSIDNDSKFCKKCGKEQ